MWSIKKYHQYKILKLASFNYDWVIKEVFKKKKGGYFVEAGATDGISGSNTYILEKKYGWTGICVEPCDEFFKQLKINRRCITDNSVLSEKDGVVQFVEFPNALGWSGILESLKKDPLSPIGPKVLVTKKSVTLQYLLKKYNSPKVIEYLCLDVEGGEFNILNCFPFEEYTILAISIEGSTCDDLLLSKGYQKVMNKYNKNCPWEHYFLHKTIVSE